MVSLLVASILLLPLEVVQAKGEASLPSISPDSTRGRSVTNTDSSKKGLIKEEKVTNSSRSVSGHVLEGFSRGLPEYIRDKSTNIIQTYMNKNEALLASALIFGRTDGMSNSMKDMLLASGMMHAVAASGYNVNLLVTFLERVTKMWAPRYLRNLLIFPLVFLYAALAGFSHSILRASWMAVFQAGASLVGKQSQAELRLILVGVLMIALDKTVLESVGFYLSLLSTLGIITAGNLYSRTRFDNKNVLLQYIRENLELSLAATCAVIPIQLIFFQELTWIGIFCNLAVSWMISPLMIIVIILLIWGILHLPGFYLFSLLAERGFSLWMGLLEMFSRVPYGVLHFSDAQGKMIGLALLFILISLYIWIKFRTLGWKIAHFFSRSTRLAIT